MRQERESIPARGGAKKVEALAKLRPAKRTEIPDDGCPGLLLAVLPSGVASWTIRYRSPSMKGADGRRGKNVAMTLGRLSLEKEEGEPALGRPLTLGMARELAREKLGEVAKGRDPMQEKKTGRAERLAGMYDTPTLLDEFIKDCRASKAKKRTVDEYERIIEKYVKPSLKGVDIRTITPLDAKHLLSKVKKPAMKRAVFVVLRRFFRTKSILLLTGGMVPTEAIDAPEPPEARDRVLSADEIRLLWQATAEVGYPAGPFARLLLLTGQRLREIANLTWLEVGDIDATEPAITLERSRTKNSNAHICPLSPAAVEILRSVPKILPGV